MNSDRPFALEVHARLAVLILSRSRRRVVFEAGTYTANIDEAIALIGEQHTADAAKRGG